MEPQKRNANLMTATNTALLEGLRERNNRTWDEFCSRYQPLLESFARRLGVHEHDAQDAAQEALLAFAVAYQKGSYNRDKGRLRSWLFAIASNKVRDLQRKRKEALIGDQKDGQAMINQVPDAQDWDQIWEAEWRKAIVDQCMKLVSKSVTPKTMEAFELFALKQLSADEVSSKLGMSRNAVYKAKNQVLGRMRELQEEFEETW